MEEGSTMIKKCIRWIKHHPYSLALLYFIPYIIYFKILETYQVPKYIIHCAIDDMIPFCEAFIIPYFAWFPFLIIALLFFMRKSKNEFLNLCFLMFSGMTICLIIYTILPNGLQLRPHILHDNLLANIAKFLYAIDTPTNVCPSIHVTSTIAVMIIVLKSEVCKHPFISKCSVVILSIAICVSTMVLKQHSVIDVICGLLLSAVLYFITYHTAWRTVLIRTPLRKIIA